MKPLSLSTFLSIAIVFVLTACQKTVLTPDPNASHEWENENLSLTAEGDKADRHGRLSPYPQTYTTFAGEETHLYGWKGKKILLLSGSENLDRSVMFRWVKAMDAAYNYYKKTTGREPVFYTPNYYIEGRATIADVSNTCGAGCGFLGWTGIELQNSTFDVMYNAIKKSNKYDQAVFYEFGRNFWFYEDQLAYKTNDPVTTGYAVFMRFMAMEAACVNGASFGQWSFERFRRKVELLINTYLATPSLNWENTLGAGQGVPGSQLGATDLFASFCFRLRRNYGGEKFVQRLWKYAGQRPAASTTQDAVDNFFIAACQAANRNLTSVFTNWRWPLSDNAKAKASLYR